MKHTFIPLAASLIAVAVAPLPAIADDAQPIDFTLPVDQEASVQPSTPQDSAQGGTEAVEPRTVPAQAAVALSFDPPQSSSGAVPNPAPIPSQPQHSKQEGVTASTSPGSEALFAGNSESVVARVVGAAEGTRAADGGKTSLYEGHTDPGNGVWNRGTFSYQFGNAENLSAEEADRRQMAKIKRIHETVLLPKAAEQGVAPLTLSEELNGIDLINQAPLAVTESGGYVERLADAKQKKGLTGEEAILDARVWAFWDPEQDGWNAPGLRAYDDISKQESIRQDQQRRMGMIAQARDSYEQQQGAIANAQPSKQMTQKIAAASPELLERADPDKVADLIIFQDSLN